MAGCVLYCFWYSSYQSLLSSNAHEAYYVLQAALTLFLLKFFFITFSMLFSCKSTSLNILYSSFVSCCCVCTLSNNVCTHEKRSDIEFIMEWRRKRSLLLKTCKDCNCCVCWNNNSKVRKKNNYNASDKNVLEIYKQIWLQWG